VTGKTEER